MKKDESTAVLFYVRLLRSLLGAELEEVRCLLLRILVNYIRGLLIIIVPLLPSPSGISELFTCAQMWRADVKAVMHTTQCPYFEQLLGSESNIFSPVYCSTGWKESFGFLFH